MITNEKLKELDSAAESFAQAKINNLRSQPRKEMAFQIFVKKKLKYDETQAFKELDEYLEIEKRRFHDEEYNTLVKKEKLKETYKAESWRLFVKNLLPFIIGEEQKPLKWSDRLKDEETGQSSPTFAEIMKEYNIADQTAVTDPQKFAEFIAQKFNGKIIEYTFDRSSTDFYKNNRSSNRWIKHSFLLKQVQVPPKT